ncbi:hypothetical protein SAMN02745704_01103 [Paucidesulfovibrio gracilis DSM 16080]|uniref:Uncharacterized protein n=1 Tax=Paucidesulfovibrio gracilis DSM 16080 TaxID=1121449 RepID=A0A1T4WLM8_9BACT|nr:hypothetical protein SAMN02745704_01103 [Paucidesulfovibrio gracilis DSM 16080]
MYYHGNWASFFMNLSMFQVIPCAWFICVRLSSESIICNFIVFEMVKYQERIGEPEPDGLDRNQQMNPKRDQKIVTRCTSASEGFDIWWLGGVF